MSDATRDWVHYCDVIAFPSLRPKTCHDHGEMGPRKHSLAVFIALSFTL